MEDKTRFELTEADIPKGSRGRRGSGEYDQIIDQFLESPMKSARLQGFDESDKTAASRTINGLRNSVKAKELKGKVSVMQRTEKSTGYIQLYLRKNGQEV